ncbi:MAG: hypothetical protein ACKVT0_03610 [Planctomycetaceae bacterium]
MQRMYLKCLCTILALLILNLFIASSLHAQTEEEINAARLKGLDYIKSKQKKEGNWVYEGHDVGITALCTMALLENGVPINDPLIERGQAFVRKNIEELTSTYDLSLAILLLSRIGDRQDRAHIRTLAARLIAGQTKTGGWSYSCPKVSAVVLSNPADLPEPADGTGDNSNTQFAVLGLWTASRSRIDIDIPLNHVARRFVQYQLADGGWNYSLADDQGAGNSMTFAGLFSLTVARANKLRKIKREATDNNAAAKDDAKSDDAQAAAPDKPESTDKPETPEVRDLGAESTTLLSDPIFAKGLEKAGEFARGIGPGSARYFLWSVERIGVLLGLEQIGGEDWFKKGAAALLATQQPDGSWPDGKGNLADTAFAVLFLRKANLGSDISRLLEGEPDKRFQIINRTEKPTFDTLADAVAGAASGDIIRINSDGPIEVPHIPIEKDVTIMAGNGYLPVLNYAIGRNKSGNRSRPERDADARHMFLVKSGELTLEGLRLEMDPPPVGKEVSWAAITIDGGSLRMLNCSISEANKRGMAALVFKQPGNIFVRNSLFVGGRAAIEIAAAGEQKITLDNCILFSPNGIDIMRGTPKPTPKLSLMLVDTTVQCANAFRVSEPLAQVDVQSYRCLYQSDWLAASFLAAQGKKEGRSWVGERNRYYVSNWLGAGKGREPSVKDAKTWNEFWSKKDVAATEGAFAFVAPRQMNAFSHSASSQDWEPTDQSNLSSRFSRAGAITTLVEPGPGYLRYRESIVYNQWIKGEEVVDLTNPGTKPPKSGTTTKPKPKK